MGKKKNKKYTPKQILIYLIGISGIIYLGIFFDKTKEDNRKKEIEGGSFKANGIVEKLKTRSRQGKGSSGLKDVVYLYYEKSDTIFHIIKSLPYRQIDKLGIKLNDCFEIRIAESDNDIFQIDFTKKLDTFIDKNFYQYQIYKTRIHKNIIE